MSTGRFAMLCMSLLVMACAAPPPAKRPPLVNSAAFPAEQREAVAEVARFLARNGEDPLDFFAEVLPSPDGAELVFRLWHVDTFHPAVRQVVGNPGGRNRDVYYDTRGRTVTRMLLWQ